MTARAKVLISIMLFDFFKKKKKQEIKKKIKLEEKEEKKQEKKKIEKQQQKKKKKKTDIAKPKEKNKKFLVGKVIKASHISEKATDLIKKNQYVLEVASRTNKIEVKKAIESVHKVNVLAVNMIKIPKKKKRVGKIFGFKKGYKKAVVRIKQGQKI